MPIDALADGPYGPPPLSTIPERRHRLPGTSRLRNRRWQKSFFPQVPFMRLNDLIAPNAILPALKVNNKKQVLQELAARAAMLTGQNERAIFDLLIQREKLGTTAIGSGIAIPHLKMPTLTRLFGLFARLDRPVDFDALDNQPVDLVFLLLAPEAAGADHLQALARIARLLRDQTVVHKLRATHDAESLYAVLAMPSASAA
jgi:PTS system nitrogen regulatory IIA component